MEKKYRIAYDELFIPYNKNNEGYKQLPDMGIFHNGTFLNDLVLMWIYKFYDMQGNEVLFEKGVNPITYTQCFYDPEKGYRLVLDEEAMRNNGYSRIEAVPYTAELSYSYNSTDEKIAIIKPKEVSFDEAVSILKMYPDAFNRKDNNPTQNLAYCNIVA